MCAFLCIALTVLAKNSGDISSASEIAFPGVLGNCFVVELPPKEVF